MWCSEVQNNMKWSWTSHRPLDLTKSILLLCFLSLLECLADLRQMKIIQSNYKWAGLVLRAPWRPGKQGGGACRSRGGVGGGVGGGDGGSDLVHIKQWFMKCRAQQQGFCLLPQNQITEVEINTPLTAGLLPQQRKCFIYIFLLSFPLPTWF